NRELQSLAHPSPAGRICLIRPAGAGQSRLRLQRTLDRDVDASVGTDVNADGEAARPPADRLLQAHASVGLEGSPHTVRNGVLRVLAGAFVCSEVVALLVVE